jgi:hypothetical protein
MFLSCPDDPTNRRHDEQKILPNETPPGYRGHPRGGTTAMMDPRGRPGMKKKSTKGKKKVRDLAVKSTKGGSVKGGLSSIKMRQ